MKVTPGDGVVRLEFEMSEALALADACDHVVNNRYSELHAAMRETLRLAAFAANVQGLLPKRERWPAWEQRHQQQEQEGV
ncbi:MAG: hypothetical protein NTZ05_09125 [Chloroflexi bacterium]|nr:hypothetical protein [Chloroflexota bacterium]